jgi:hypothetical protein
VSEPWDQLESEPAASYARFLLYRGLLPGARSLGAAYQLTARKGKNGVKKRAPGPWYADSAKYRWEERAHAWDIHVLTTSGEKAVVRMTALVCEVVERALSSKLPAHPQSWSELLETVRVLSTVIPAEAASLLQRRHAAEQAGWGGDGNGAARLGGPPHEPGGLREGPPRGDPLGQAGGDPVGPATSPVPGPGQERP